MVSPQNQFFYCPNCNTQQDPLTQGRFCSLCSRLLVASSVAITSGGGGGGVVKSTGHPVIKSQYARPWMKSGDISIAVRRHIAAGRYAKTPAELLEQMEMALQVLELNGLNKDFLLWRQNYSANSQYSGTSWTEGSPDIAMLRERAQQATVKMHGWQNLSLSNQADLMLELKAPLKGEDNIVMTNWAAAYSNRGRFYVKFTRIFNWIGWLTAIAAAWVFFTGSGFDSSDWQSPLIMGGVVSVMAFILGSIFNAQR